MTFAKSLLQLVLSPANGWDDIAGADIPLDTVSRHGFYPLTAITAITVFAGLLWHPTATLAQKLTEAVITFVMFFGGYYAGALILSVTLDRYVYQGRETVSIWRCHTFSLYSMALLEIITLIHNCIPMTEAITVFLPLGVLLVMWMGRRFMLVPEGRGGEFLAIVTLGVLIPPYLLQWLLNALLPMT